MKIWELKPNKINNYSTISVLQLLTTFGKPDLATLSLLNDEFPFYTKLIEDGNSFYRSVAIAYILSFDDWSFNNLFPKIQTLNLTQIDIKSIPEQFLPIYTNEQLKKIFEQGWTNFIQESQTLQWGSIEGLLKVLNQRHVLILNENYVNERTLTYSNTLNPKKLSQHILTYGNTTIQKQQIKSLANALQSQIYIVTIDKQHNLNSQIIQPTKNNKITLKRLSLLKVRDAFNPLYSSVQVKQSKLANQSKIKQRQTSRRFKNHNSSTLSNQKTNPKYQQLFKQSSLPNKSLQNHRKHSSNSKIEEQSNSKLKFDFTMNDVESDQQLSNTPVNLYKNKRSKSSYQPAQPSAKREQQSQNTKNTFTNLLSNWNLSKILRLLIIVCAIVSIFTLIFGGKWSSSQKFEYPAREVNFVKDQLGNYQVYE